VVLVKDWETCSSEDWYGSMTTTTRVARDEVRHGETPDVVIRHEAKYSHDATVNVAGAVATADITSEELVASDQKSGYGRITSRRVAAARYSGPVNLSVSVNPRLGSYDVGFERPALTGTVRTTGTCERPAPYKCQPPVPTSRPWDGDSRYLTSMSGTIDPDDPTRISDSQTIRGGALEHTLKVDLQRCR
jgi:hypothetical protein